MMRPKVFFLFAIVASLLSGCKFEPYASKEEIMVAQVLKSQISLRQSNQSDIYSLENFYHDSNTVDHILSQQYGLSSARVQGYYNASLNFSDLALEYDVDTQTQDYLYDYRGYMYDAYGERFHFVTTSPFVGKANLNPHKGTMEIEGESSHYVVRVINDKEVQISVYNHYDSYQDHVLYSSWKNLGF